MKNCIDLHTHTTLSDGTDSPEELIEKAKLVGLRALALTDHDNFNGLVRARKKAMEEGIEFINGIELSADYIKGEVHILGYFFDKDPTEDEDLMREIARLQEIRRQRNVKLFEKLHEVGVCITEEDVLAQMKNERLMCRPHFAMALIQKGYAADMQEAFDKYLGDDGLAFVSKRTISPEETIEILKKAKAFVSLAHPFLIRCKNEEERRGLIERLASCGLHGIEVHYSENSEEETRLSLEYAKNFGLIPTGGSDYHGNNKLHIALGRGKGNLAIDYSVLEKMKAFVAAQK